MHCRIWREFDPAAPTDDSVATFMVEDNATNGTYVRGAKLGKGNVTILFSGDKLSFGPVGSLTPENDEYREHIVIGLNLIPALLTRVVNWIRIYLLCPHSWQAYSVSKS